MLRNGLGSPSCVSRRVPNVVVERSPSHSTPVAWRADQLDQTQEFAICGDSMSAPTRSKIQALVQLQDISDAETASGQTASGHGGVSQLPVVPGMSMPSASMGPVMPTELGSAADLTGSIGRNVNYR